MISDICGKVSIRVTGDARRLLRCERLHILHYIQHSDIMAAMPVGQYDGNKNKASNRQVIAYDLASCEFLE